MYNNTHSPIILNQQSKHYSHNTKAITILTYHFLNFNYLGFIVPKEFTRTEKTTFPNIIINNWFYNKKNYYDNIDISSFPNINNSISTDFLKKRTVEFRWLTHKTLIKSRGALHVFLFKFLLPIKRIIL